MLTLEVALLLLLLGVEHAFAPAVCTAGSIDLNDLSRLVDAAASLTSADDVTLQGVLEQLAVPAR